MSIRVHVVKSRSPLGPKEARIVDAAVMDATIDVVCE